MSSPGALQKSCPLARFAASHKGSVHARESSTTQTVGSNSFSAHTSRSCPAGQAATAAGLWHES
eukprot:3485163-Amphidinium_carterae.1